MYFDESLKSRIQHHCERSELRLHFEWTKLIKMPKMTIWRFCKLEDSCQTVLPDRSLLTGQKLSESAKIEKFKCDILCDFQTLCILLASLASKKIRLLEELTIICDQSSDFFACCKRRSHYRFFLAYI